MHDGKIYRKDVDESEDYPYFLNGAYRVAANSNQIILMTSSGRGKTLKNRYSGKTRYFTRQEMVMLSLQAESI